MLRDDETGLCGPHDFELLLKARRCARCAERDPWEFAVELEELKQIGVSNTQLRWLICRGYLEVRRELTGPQDGARRFARHTNLHFPDNCCFVLTAAGEQLAEASLNRHFPGLSHPRDSKLAASPTCPRWDAVLRELRWGELVVKSFRVPSPNQELVLTAWEEECWPVQIADPLPRGVGIDTKRRLHDTIKRLNRNQVHRLLRFEGDGRGLGVRWSLIRQQSEKFFKNNGNS
jgi:hypothetical protein